MRFTKTTGAVLAIGLVLLGGCSGDPDTAETSDPSPGEASGTTTSETTDPSPDVTPADETQFGIMEQTWQYRAPEDSRVFHIYEIGEESMYFSLWTSDDAGDSFHLLRLDAATGEQTGLQPLNTAGPSDQCTISDAAILCEAHVQGGGEFMVLDSDTLEERGRVETSPIMDVWEGGIWFARDGEYFATDESGEVTRSWSGVPDLLDQHPLEFGGHVFFGQYILPLEGGSGEPYDGVIPQWVLSPDRAIGQDGDNTLVLLDGDLNTLGTIDDAHIAGGPPVDPGYECPLVGERMGAEFGDPNVVFLIDRDTFAVTDLDTPLRYGAMERETHCIDGSVLVALGPADDVRQKNLYLIDPDGTTHQLDDFQIDQIFWKISDEILIVRFNNRLHLFDITRGDVFEDAAFEELRDDLFRVRNLRGQPDGGLLNVRDNSVTSYQFHVDG